MELRSIQSPAVSTVPTKIFIDKHYGQLIKSFGTKRILQPNAGKLKVVHFKVQASGATKLGSQPVEANSKDAEVKDGNLIFVAGATGKVGSRTVRELLKLGFNVRAGVRSTQRAEPLVKSVQQMKFDEALTDGTQPIEKLELVLCDLEKPEQIRPALGRASTVICCIGASEKEVLDVTGPYRIDFQATKNLIDAATTAKVKNFILLTSLGTNKVGFPAAILNLFWGVLIWKRKAEEALLASGIPYTIVRPGGMERPTDSYKETHNITLSTEDTLFGGQVSNLQVAELMAFMAKNPGLSYCKVVEVIAETTAPLTPMGDLLAKIPPQRAGAYQPEEPKPTKDKEPEPVPTSIKSETETVPQSKPASTRPLSPYTVYEGLKPPVSPIPTAPGSSNVVVEAVSKPESTDSATVAVTAEPATIAVTAEPATVAVGVQTTRPLSPYTAYEGLKPPVSPIPTAPASSNLVVEAVSEPKSTDSETSTKAATVAVTAEPASVAVGVQTTRPLSPYAVYDDLKPPTSPSPSSPSSSSSSAAAPADNGAPITAMPQNSSTSTQVKPRALSPYPMYDDLKPPSSPTPSNPYK